jgi:hypothetical protein
VCTLSSRQRCRRPRRCSNCFIDSQCVANGGTAEANGYPCLTCDTTQDTSAWVESAAVGVTECYIGGNCYNGAAGDTAADYLAYTPRYSSPSISSCQYCDPPKDKNAWSVADGYKVVADVNPPDDCALDDVTTTDTSSDTSDSSTEGGAVRPLERPAAALGT